MGRRHRELQQQQQQRRRAARTAARPAGGSPVTRYVVDLVGIFLIAAVLNFALYEVGILNFVVRVMIGLVVGRLVMTFGRRYLERRADSRGGSGR